MYSTIVLEPCDFATIASSGSISAHDEHQIAVRSSTRIVLCNLYSSVLVSMSADVLVDKHSTITRTEIRCLIGRVESYLVHEVIMVMLAGFA